jgi:hypothetical protein
MIISRIILALWYFAEHLPLCVGGGRFNCMLCTFFTSDYARIKKVHYSRQAIVMRADSVSLMVDENSQDNRTKGSLSWSI